MRPTHPFGNNIRAGTRLTTSPRRRTTVELRDVMTPHPTVCAPGTSVVEAAALMRDQAIGDVLVEQATGPLGIVTDRDITTRVVANGRDAKRVTVGEVCTRALTTVAVDTPVEEVIALMSSQAVRRIPVMDGERPVGIVSLGDLAVDRDGSSALGRISAAQPSEQS
jgi:CBS domain-containing protein